MRATLGRMVMLSIVAAFGMGVKNHTPTSSQRKPLSLVASDPPLVAQTADFCAAGISDPPKEIGLDKGFAIGALNALSEFAFEAKDNGLFGSKVWNEFKDLMSSLSNEELASFVGVDRNNACWLNHALWVYQNKFVCEPLENTRETLIFMVFLNFFGAEAMTTPPEDIDKDLIGRNIAAFKRVNSAAKNFPGVYVLHQHPQYLFIDSRFIKPSEKVRANSGKWLILVGSLKEAEKIVAEALIPCFAYGRWDLLKFGLAPLIKEGNREIYRIIVYDQGENAEAREILERLTGAEVTWVHEWECHEAGILQKALIQFTDATLAERNRGVPEPRIKEFDRQINDKDFMLSLGLREYQYKLILLLLYLRLESIDELKKPGAYIAFAYFRPAQLIWRLLEVALRPENQEQFKAHLDSFRIRKERNWIVD